MIKEVFNFFAELDYVRNTLVPFAVFTITNVVKMCCLLKEKYNDFKIYMYPIYIEEVFEFTKDELYYDIKKSFEQKLKRNPWSIIDSLKNPSTDYVEVIFNFYGKRMRLILDENFNPSNITHTNEIVYSYLNLEKDEETDKIDITDLLKEYINIPFDKLDLKYISEHVDLDVYYYDNVDIVISRLFDMDEVTIKLK